MTQTCPNCGGQRLSGFRKTTCLDCHADSKMNPERFGLCDWGRENPNFSANRHTKVIVAIIAKAQIYMACTACYFKLEQHLELSNITWYKGLQDPQLVHPPQEEADYIPARLIVDPDSVVIVPEHEDHNLPSWVAILIQKGEGCDYTIGCGKRISDPFHAATYEDALRSVQSALFNDDHPLSSKGIYAFGTYSDNELHSVYVIPKPEPVPLDDWMSQHNLMLEREEMDEQEETERAELERLKTKYGEY